MNQSLEEHTRKTEPLPQGKASFFEVLRAISLGLLGFRSRNNFKDELPKISVAQAFLGGILGVIIFMAVVTAIVMLAVKTMG